MASNRAENYQLYFLIVKVLNNRVQIISKFLIK